MTNNVAIRDLRDLPFFQVRLDAVEAIRDTAPGRSRARTVGFYAICCQLANEQRHSGEQRRFVTNYDELAARARIARKTIRAMLSTLDQAGALRVELTSDLDRGSVITTLHLPIQDGPFAAITVAMARHLAASHGRVIARTSRGDLGGYLTRDLGIVVTLLEFCVKQYNENGGGRALLERAELARRAGLSIDSVDNCVKILEALGLLAVERRRGANGGRFRPSVYSLLEPSQAIAREAPPNADVGNPQGGGSILPTRSQETRRAESRNQQGGGSTNPTLRLGIDKAEPDSTQGGVSVLPETSDQRSIARPRSGLKLQPIEDSLSPPSPLSSDSDERGEGDDRNEVLLCSELVEVLGETRGPGPGRRYDAGPEIWHAAAGRILADHPVGKVREAIAYLPFDQIVGTKVRSMPDLERHIEDLRHRAHAANAQPQGTRPALVPADAPSWPEAKAEVMRAIQRHGAGAKATALAELDARHPQLRRFAEKVGWASLCQSPIDKQDYSYRMAWDALLRDAQAEEAA